jgi:hypothetical protein
MNAPLPDGSHAWYQLTVVIEFYWKGRRAANVGGERVSHDLVTPRVLRGPDALNGDAEAPGEGYVSV